MTNGTHSYQDLLQKFEPRPIANEEQYDAVVAQMNALIDQEKLTAAEQDILTLLGTLVMAYEDEHYPDANFMLYGLDLLRSLMAEAKLQVEDLLPVFETKAAVVDVLGGETLPTPEQIAKLSAFFGLPEPLFTFTDNRAFA
ncbi:MAG: transcriptional regulator [Caldilinea sp. CFX5]|nr:transcriptional regulator [Caldilinea sp. CFX5]